MWMTLSSAFLTMSCGGDHDPAGSGTGGDEIPDESPGPHGPSCTSRIGQPLGGATDETIAQAQPAMVVTEVAFDEQPTGSEDDLPHVDRAAPTALPLTSEGRP